MRRYREEWAGFLQSVHAERRALATTNEQLEAYVVDVPTSPPQLLTAQLLDAKKRFAEKGRLGLFAGDTKQAVAACRVNGRAPTTAADVDLCLAELQRAGLRRQLTTRWSNRMSRCDGPQLEGPLPEDELVRHLEQLERVLEASGRWEQLRGAFAGVDIGSPTQLDHESIDRLLQVLAVATERPGGWPSPAGSRAFGAISPRAPAAPGASPVWHWLAQALAARDDVSWTRHRRDVEYAAAIAPATRCLIELRQRLRSAAPRWSSRIDADPSAAGDPALVEQAWAWRRLRYLARGPRRVPGPLDPPAHARTARWAAPEGRGRPRH